MEFFDKTREWSRVRKRIVALAKRHPEWSQVDIGNHIGKHKQYINKVLKEHEKATKEPSLKDRRILAKSNAYSSGKTHVKD